MECAGRALSFWAYQTTQNIYYQQYLYRTLTDKYSNLGIRLEKTVSDANTEIEGLQHKMSSQCSLTPYSKYIVLTNSRPSGRAGKFATKARGSFSSIQGEKS